MKKILMCSVMLIWSTVIVGSTPEDRIAQEKENMKILAEMGLPLPGSGINLVPRTVLHLTSEEIEEGEKELAEFKKQGYVYKYAEQADELLNMTHASVNKEIKRFAEKPKPTYTGFSRSIDELKLGFKFPSVSQNSMFSNSFSDIEILAAAPQGGFHQDNGGWSGAAEFFTYKDVGTCSYSVMNVKVSNTAVRLALEDVTYTINHKATILLPVIGSESSGFLYALRWYDEKNFHELECANRRFSAELNAAVIELAKKIDKH